ncbi:MAG TPA: glutamate formimidoyltransferase [Candidatus Dormibacteraeota bacterium]|nr:glutamate formimidoyltransferase [Candidatus Dormibacteraeota bacterium]
MKRLIECVPNFSEGRDLAKVDAIAEAMSGVPGAWVLDRTSDSDHNRSVITLAGEPESVAEAAVRGVGKAAELIDMTHQTGEHPRIGATDVLPFVPLEGVSIEQCAALARSVGREIWERYRIPVYFYEAAATRPDRVNLENVRKGQFEGLREDALRDPDRSPDIGEPRLHPTAGATAVGARKLLIAYNIHLNTNDVSIAKEIARAIRFSSGGLRHVKAIGVDLRARGHAQVSINLTDFEQTPMHRVFAMVKREAERHGCAVAGSEIIGLIPRKAIELAAEYYLQLENFSAERVLENRLAAVAGGGLSAFAAQKRTGTQIQPVLETLRQASRQIAEAAEIAKSTATGAHSRQDFREASPENDAEASLETALLAVQLFEQLAQLEPLSAPPVLGDLRMARSMALGAARGAIENTRISLQSARDPETVARIKSQVAAIEARLLAGAPARH